MRALKLGTRGSPLALVQAHTVRDGLIALDPALGAPGALEIVVIKTTGDSILDRTLADAGGKGLFTKEIEDALIEGTIDLAVHSMKDVPTVLPDGLVITAMLPREDVRDAWFGRDDQTLETLPAGAVVGTASLRRQAQVLMHRPDLTVVPIRGNVGTRLDKLAAGTVDATMLAAAGLNRLGSPHTPTRVMPTDIMLPAVAQGAIGIEMRSDDADARALVDRLGCPATALRVDAERALLAVLDGSCRTPIAALATLADDTTVALEAMVLAPDGQTVFQTSRRGAVGDAVALGADAGAELKAQLPPSFFTT